VYSNYRGITLLSFHGEIYLQGVGKEAANNGGTLNSGEAVGSDSDASH